MLGLRRLPQPVIARVQGVATAAGCQLVAACDLAVAAEEATFATPGVKIGLFCTTPMVPLVRAIPAKAAMEMLLTGVPITARRALELGLVNRVVPDADLDLEVKSLTDYDHRHEPAGHPDRQEGVLRDRGTGRARRLRSSRVGHDRERPFATTPRKESRPSCEKRCRSGRGHRSLRTIWTRISLFRGIV